MASAELHLVPILLLAVIGMVSALFVAMSVAALFGRRFLFSDAYPKPWMAIFAFVSVPIWGGAMSVFWFEGFGDVLFNSPEAKDIVHGSFMVALFALWAVVIVGILIFIAQSIRANPNLVVGAITALMILAGYVAADYFFQLPAFDFIDASEEAR